MENEDELVRMIKRELGADSGFEDAESVPFLGKQLLVTTDMLTDGDDFPPGMPYDAIGWKAVAASLSDLAAAGAKPLGMTMAWGLPRVMPEEGARQIAKGMAKCARAHKTRVWRRPERERKHHALRDCVRGCALSLEKGRGKARRLAGSHGQAWRVIRRLSSLLVEKGKENSKRGDDAPQVQLPRGEGVAYGGFEFALACPRGNRHKRRILIRGLQYLQGKQCRRARRVFGRADGRGIRGVLRKKPQEAP